MKLGPITIDTGTMSPTNWWGAIGSAGLAIVGVQVVYPAINMPHWVLVTGAIMVVVGNQLHAYFGADDRDVPTPPAAPEKK